MSDWLVFHWRLDPNLMEKQGLCHGKNANNAKKFCLLFSMLHYQYYTRHGKWLKRQRNLIE